MELRNRIREIEEAGEAIFGVSHGSEVFISETEVEGEALGDFVIILEKERHEVDAGALDGDGAEVGAAVHGTEEHGGPTVAGEVGVRVQEGVSGERRGEVKDRGPGPGGGYVFPAVFAADFDVVLADVFRHLRIDVERVRFLVPIAGAAESGGGALGDINTGVIDIGQAAEVGFVPCVAGPELIEVGFFEGGRGDSEGVDDGVESAADIEDRGGVEGVDHVAGEAEGMAF